MNSWEKRLCRMFYSVQFSSSWQWNALSISLGMFSEVLPNAGQTPAQGHFFSSFCTISYTLTSVRRKKDKFAHQPLVRIYISFHSMKQLEVFPLPPSWNADPCQGSPIAVLCHYPFIHLGGEGQYGGNFLDQGNNLMAPHLEIWSPMTQPLHHCAYASLGFGASSGTKGELTVLHHVLLQT